MVISEFSHNHLGRLDLLEKMVKEAKNCGVTYAKIQTHFAEDLAPGWLQDYDRVKSYSLNERGHKFFVEMCKAEGLIPMTSVYTEKYAPMLWEAGFRHIKIGSAEVMNESLIRMYLTIGFRVMISTGGRDLQKLPRVHPLEGVLHCVSKYPCRPNEANLGRMVELKKWFPHSTPIGFSSHIDPIDPEWMYPLFLASHMGANFIEVHFTMIDRNDTKDGRVSLYPDQLRQLCEFDRLEPNEKLEYHPWFGVVSSPQSEQEIAIIEKYETRWKRELPH